MSVLSLLAQHPHEEAYYFRCHNKCYNTPDCNWYTSYGEGAICNLYADCDNIDDTSCSTCVTGEVTCPICGLEGICEGTAIHFEVVASQTECENLCVERPDNCAFYSYDGGVNCWLFGDCELQSASFCPQCQSSQVGCATNSTTTTTEPPTGPSAGPSSTEDPAEPTTESEAPTNPTTSAPPGEECPDGWEEKPEFGKCYFFMDGGVPWSEANEACMALDAKASLTSVQSEEENDYVQTLVQDLAWTGGSDEDEEGVWRWVEDDSLVEEDFSNWLPGEPSDSEGQNCMAMRSSDGKWYDTSCNSATPAAVCSKRV